MFTKIYCEGTIGGVEWSNDENSIAFLGEPSVVTTNFFSLPKSSDSADKKIPSSTQYDFKDDWGEQYVGASNPTIFIYNLDLNTFSKVSLSYSVIGFCWVSLDSFIVVGMDNHHRRLGMVFYNSRPADLYLVSVNKPDTNDLSSELSTLSPESIRLTFGYSARNPRLINNFLYFTSTDNVWFHTSCEKLLSISWPILNFKEISINQVVEIPTVCLYA